MLPLRLKYVAKLLIAFPRSPGSLLLCLLILFQRRSQAIEYAQNLLKKHPNNWNLHYFLIRELQQYSDPSLSIELLELFILNNAVSPDRGLQQRTDPANIIDLFRVCASDARDYCELRALNINSDMSVSLYIPYAGRFSNFIIQISNALSIAGAFSIRNIFVAPSPVLADIFTSLSPVFCSDPGVTINFDIPHRGFVIESLFFHVGRQSSVLFSQYRMADVVSWFSYATHFGHDIISKEQTDSLATSSGLVIHLRSGDIFHGQSVHSEYGQPPLSYYLAAIRHSRADLVTLVYEDMANPVVGALKKYLQSSGISYNTQSSSLLSDLRILINASSLVISRGTFALGALCFNSSIQTLYCFNSSQEVDPYMRVHLSRTFYGSRILDSMPAVIEVQDSLGKYFSNVCCDNWRNNSYQRELMLNYPVNCLSIKMHYLA